MIDSTEHNTESPHLLGRPLVRCPECGSDQLRSVVDFDDVQFFCEECARCWHAELGYVHRVDPNTCSHCAHFERCAAVFGVDRRSS